MAISAVVKDGQIMETASQQSVSSASKTSSTEKTAPDGYDKDSFLQLLVAQMKYQDPLEPTSNTEYISQYATFSQVEQLQNMASTMELGRASNYVGKVVEVATKDSKGEDTIIQGTVDYIKYENNKAYVSINGNLYAAEDVTAVINEDYADAEELAEALATAINSLPALDNISLADAENIETLVTTFDKMSAYQQSFIDDSYADLLEKYYKKIVELQAEERTKAEAEKAGEEKAEENTDETVKEAGETTDNNIDGADTTVQA